jgi:hypothetical protein
MGKGFKHGGGGGSDLNFKVVGGTSAPSSPKENTIWVNTNTEISSWDFSATQPRVRSNNKNLICYPFINASRTVSGITFTDFGDGSIAIEGKATANVYHHLCNIDLGNKYFNSNSVPGGYVISGLVSGVTLEYKSDMDGLLHLTIPKDTTVSATVRPQIEKGSAATSFVKGDATGQVWVTTGNSSGVAFNALKKNRIQLYPISAKQYVGGAWTDVTAKSYKSGEWVEWRDYIVRGGTAIKNLAILNAAWDSSTDDKGNNATITQNNGYVIVKGTKSGYCAAYVQVNITNATRLVVEGEFVSDSSNSGEGKTTLAAWSNIGTYVSSNMVASVVLTSTGASLDVSGLNGTMYVGITSVYTNEQKIVNLYLE